MTARYPLAPMRATRTRDERVQRADLAGAAARAAAVAGDAARATARVDRARAAVVAATAARDRRLAQGVTAGALVQIEHDLDRRRRALAGAIAEHGRAESDHRAGAAALDDARRRHTAARAGRELTERHFAAWRADQRARRDRRED